MKKYISLAIMVSLLSGKRFTAPFLAKKYETSVKTIYRSIDSLLEAGMPIISISGSGGGYELIKGAEISTSFFTTKELAYFLSFLKSSKKNFDFDENFNIEDRLELLNKDFVKLLDQKSNELIIDTEIWGSSFKEQSHELIKDAIRNQVRLKIQYQSNQECSFRVIEPYTLVYKAGVWYVYAFCLMRKDFRLFKLSKIKNISSLNEKFERKNIDVSSKPWNENFKRNNEIINVTIETSQVDDDVFSWLDNYKIKASGENKIITGTAVYSYGLVHRIMQLGTKIKIIEPIKLKTAVMDECLAVYENLKNEPLSSFK